MTELRRAVHLLYFGAGSKAAAFRFALLVFDIVTIVFFIVASMLPHTTWFLVADIIVATVLIADFAARFWISDRRWTHMTQITVIADIIVIVTLLLPAFVENLAFLRVMRALRLLRSYHVLQDLRARSSFFARNEEILQSVVNLFVFIFVITAMVYVMQVSHNDHITNYLDALYFTVTTLTTTGFGDIILQGTDGKILSVVIMIFGVALFLRLVQTIFRPAKVRYKCPDCGLNRHDPDAVHCKHCGLVLHIETGGE